MLDSDPRKHGDADMSLLSDVGVGLQNFYNKVETWRENLNIFKKPFIIENHNTVSLV